MDPITKQVTGAIEQLAPASLHDEHLLKIIDEIYSKKNIEVKTDLSIRQIMAISKGLLFADRYKCKIMRDFCNKIMILSVSKDRKSRKEFTDISSSMRPEQPAQVSLPQRLGL
jgi:hypothetical protein